MKRQVDLRREQLKLQLDNSSDEIIQSIESAKENCIKLSKETIKISTEIEKSKEELTELVGRFDTFEIDNEKFEEIRESLTVLNEDLTRKLEEFKDSIIGDKEYTFEFEEIDIKGLFGYFKEVEKVTLNLIASQFLFLLGYYSIFYKDVRISYNGPVSPEPVVQIM